MWGALVGFQGSICLGARRLLLDISRIDWSQTAQHLAEARMIELPGLVWRAIPDFVVVLTLTGAVCGVLWALAGAPGNSPQKAA